MALFNCHFYKFMKNLTLNNRLVFTFLLMFCSGAVIAQNSYFAVKGEKLGTTFSFPVFASTIAPAACLKINQFLQLSELQLLKGNEKEEVFENIIMDSSSMYSKKVQLSYLIITNTPKLLSIKFKDMSCGNGGCVESVRYYNFNPANGDLIQVKDLLTEEGYNSFYKYAAAKRVKALDQQLLGLDEQEKMMWEGIRICYNESTLSDFYVKDNILYMDGENCFYNTQKAEPIKRMDNFTLAEFRNYLNAYGKAVFSLSNEPLLTMKSKTLPQLFTGTVNDTAAVMVLNFTYGQDMKGIYSYVQKGAAITMEGNLKGEQLFLAEVIAPVGATPYLNGLFTGNQIRGTLSDRKKTIAFRVELNRN